MLRRSIRYPPWPCEPDFKFKPFGVVWSAGCFIFHSSCLSFPPGSADGVRRTKTGCIATETSPILTSEIGLSIYPMTRAMATVMSCYIFLMNHVPGWWSLCSLYGLWQIGVPVTWLTPFLCFLCFLFSTLFPLFLSYIRDLVPPRLHSRVMHGMTEMEFSFYFYTSLRLIFPFAFLLLSYSNLGRDNIP